MNSTIFGVAGLAASVEVPSGTEQLPILQIDLWAIVISLLNLLILFLLFKKFLFKPVKKIFADRKAQVDAVYKEAEDARNEAVADKELYAEKIGNADAEAEEILRSATDKAKKTGDEIVKNAHSEAESIRKKAERDIEQEKIKAVNDAKNEIASISVMIAEKIVEREVNENDQKDYVDRFVDDLSKE